MTIDSKNPETLALHAGWRSDPTTNSVAVPIHQTTSYQFDSTEHAANLFAILLTQLIPSGRYPIRPQAQTLVYSALSELNKNTRL